ncbi:MAG: hypothetical protein C0615_06600 [Desulfuromonas sp.]|nr:MAG: hypothetical protein C0615_06600 [Desulfuromonas sp.]
MTIPNRGVDGADTTAKDEDGAEAPTRGDIELSDLAPSSPSDNLFGTAGKPDRLPPGYDPNPRERSDAEKRIDDIPADTTVSPLFSNGGIGIQVTIPNRGVDGADTTAKDEDGAEAPARGDIELSDLAPSSPSDNLFGTPGEPDRLPPGYDPNPRERSDAEKQIDKYQKEDGFEVTSADGMGNNLMFQYSIYTGGSSGTTRSLSDANLPIINWGQGRGVSSEGELAAWELIEDSESIDDYRDFLELFPDGGKAEIALSRIGQLEKGEHLRSAWSGPRSCEPGYKLVQHYSPSFRSCIKVASPQVKSMSKSDSGKIKWEPKYDCFGRKRVELQYKPYSSRMRGFSDQYLVTRSWKANITPWWKDNPSQYSVPKSWKENITPAYMDYFGMTKNDLSKMKTYDSGSSNYGVIKSFGLNAGAKPDFNALRPSYITSTTKNGKPYYYTFRGIGDELVTLEKESWSKLKQSSNLYDFQRFIAAFPGGQYALAAKLRSKGILAELLKEAEKKMEKLVAAKPVEPVNKEVENGNMVDQEIEKMLSQANTGISKYYSKQEKRVSTADVEKEIETFNKRFALLSELRDTMFAYLDSEKKPGEDKTRGITDETVEKEFIRNELLAEIDLILKEANTLPVPKTEATRGADLDTMFDSKFLTSKLDSDFEEMVEKIIARAKRNTEAIQQEAKPGAKKESVE